MKPIVVSAAAAGRPPNAVPRVSAALPCNKRRREMLLIFISCSPLRGKSPAGLLATPPVRRGLERHVASLVPAATFLLLSLTHWNNLDILGFVRRPEKGPIVAMANLEAFSSHCMQAR